MNNRLSRLCLFLLGFAFSIPAFSQNLVVGGNMENEADWNLHQYNDPAEPTFEFNYTDSLPKFGRGGCLHVVQGEASGQGLLWQRIKLTAGKTYRATGAIACLNYSGGPVGGGDWYQMYIDTAQVVEGADYNPGAIKFFNMDGWQAAFPEIFDNFWESENLYAGVPSAPYYTAPGTPGEEVEVTFGVKFGQWWTDYTGTGFELLVDEIGLFPVETAINAGGDLEDESPWKVNYNPPGTVEPTFEFNYTDSLPKFGQGGCLHVLCGEAWGQGLLYQRIKLIAGETYRATGAIACLGYAGGPTGGGAWYQMYIDTAQVIEGAEYNPGAIKFFNMDGWQADFPEIFDNFWESENLYAGVPSAPYYTPPGTPGEEVEVTFGIKFGQWWTDYTGTGFELLVDDVYLFPMTEAGITTSVESKTVSPNTCDLAQNYPNPFNPKTMIKYTIRQAGQIRLTVFDLLGHEVATLVDSRQAAGPYSVQFDGSGLSSGVYFYKLETGSQVITRKMMLMK